MKKISDLSQGHLAVLTAGLAAAALTVGCGVQYRPVASAINPVGPAGQPTKYAVAVSNPNQAQDAVTSYSITGNVLTVTLSATNPFSVGQLVTLSGFANSTFLNGQIVTLLTSSTTPTSQFTATFPHANVVTTTEAGEATVSTSSSVVTFVDFSGDTILSTPQILPNPYYFAINNSGTAGYVVNPDSSLNYFNLSNPTSVITSTIGQTTLPVGYTPISLSAFTPSSAISTLFVPEASATNPTIAALNSSTAALYSQVAVGPNPIYVVGADGAPRVYAISQGTTPGVSTGQAAAIEATSATSLSVSATIPVGLKPVYGVMTSDDRRAFILNQGSGSVTVINVINNAIDAAVPTGISIPNITSGGSTYAPNPVWADLSPVTNELVVLNQGDGVHPGTLSIINIPLCSNTTPTSPANPNCSSTNPVDATGFGTIVANVPVGVNPTMVSVLKDGTAAYVANSGNATTQGSVSVVSLTTNTVVASIPASSLTSAPTSDVYGHPTTIAATTGSPAGKVYVTSPDSTYLTIIYTDTNTVQNHLSLQGNGFKVVVTSP